LIVGSIEERVESPSPTLVSVCLPACPGSQGQPFGPSCVWGPSRSGVSRGVFRVLAAHGRSRTLGRYAGAGGDGGEVLSQRLCHPRKRWVLPASQPARARRPRP